MSLVTVPTIRMKKNEFLRLSSWYSVDYLVKNIKAMNDIMKEFPLGMTPSAYLFIPTECAIAAGRATQGLKTVISQSLFFTPPPPCVCLHLLSVMTLPSPGI